MDQNVDRHSSRHELIEQLRKARERIDELEASLDTFEEDRHRLEPCPLGWSNALAQLSEDAVSVVDSDQIYRLVNPAYERLFGTPKRAIIGCSVSELHGSEAFSRLIEARLARALTGEVVRYADWFDLPALGRRYMDVVYHPLRDSQGQIIGLLNIARDDTGRAAAEVKQRESEERYRRLARNAWDVIYRMSLPDGKYLFVSAGAEAIFGYTSDEMVASPLLIRSMIHPDDQAYFQRQWTALLDGEMPPEYEYRILTKSGQQKWLRQRNALIKDDQGRPIAIEGVVNDMTAYRHAEEALRQSEARYRLLFEGSDHPVAIYNRAAEFLMANQAAARRLETTTENLLGKPLGAFVPAFHELTVQRIAQALDDRRSFQVEDTLTIGGQSITFFSIIQPLEDLLDGQEAVQILSYDVTDRKRAEEARQESEQRFSRAFHNSHVAMALLDPAGRFIDVNDRSCQMYGYMRDELLGMSILDITHPDDLSKCEERYGHYVRDKLDGYTCEKRYLTKNGHIRWALLVISNVRNADGVFLYSVSQTIDLTPLRQAHEALIIAKEEAETANHAKSEFLANMSHELRTPLNGVQGMLQLLKLADLGPDQLEQVDIALESSDGLLQVLNDILDLSKLEVEQMATESEPFGLEALMQSVIRSFAIDARKKNLTLQVHTAPDVPDVLIGDAPRLRQVLFNLVGNGVKFTEQGQVQVEVSLKDRLGQGPVRLIFSVIDTGIGISAEMLDKIFEPFTQADGSAKRSFRGTGLGLPIVKRLVNLMGGHVSVQSSATEGTRVTLDIPFGTLCGDGLTIDDLDRAAPTADRRTEDPLNILLVDDDPTRIKVLSIVLGSWGHRIVNNHDIQDALASLSNQTLDLVLIDMDMSTVKGVESVLELRNSLEGQMNSSIPIVLLTIEPMQMEPLSVLNAPFDDYLRKPIDINDLKAVLANVERRRDQQNCSDPTRC